MLSKAKIKWINSLKLKKFREIEGFFIVEGIKNVKEFVESNYNIDTIVLEEQVNLEFNNTKTIRCTAEEYKQISTFEAPAGCLAIVEIPKTKMFFSSENILLLDGIKDPGNMGTIIRTADWFGIKKIICSKDSVDVYNPKCVSSAMGSLSRMEILYTDLIEFVNLQSQYTYYAATLHGNEIQNVKPVKPFALIIGSESHGISSKLLEVGCQQIKIKSKNPKTESLNAAIASAILLHHMTI